MARRIQVTYVVHITHDDHLEDNTTHIIEEWDYTESVEEAVKQGIIDDTPDDIISWIVSD